MDRRPNVTEQKPLSDQELNEIVLRLLKEGRWPILVVREDRRELLAEIKKLLDDQRHNVRCRFSEEEAGGVLRMLTGGGERKAPLRDLRLWLKGAKRVVIADPYFMHGDPTSWGWGSLTDDEKKRKAEDYAEEVRQILGTVEEVDLFHLPGPPKEVQTAVRKKALKGKKVKAYETTEIHDRIWIRDGEDARIVGTSFGGIGRKLSFIVELPQDDRALFQTELNRIRKK